MPARSRMRATATWMVAPPRRQRLVIGQQDPDDRDGDRGTFGQEVSQQEVEEHRHHGSGSGEERQEHEWVSVGEPVHRVEHDPGSGAAPRVGGPVQGVPHTESAGATHEGPIVEDPTRAEGRNDGTAEHDQADQAPGDRAGAAALPA